MLAGRRAPVSTRSASEREILRNPASRLTGAAPSRHPRPAAHERIEHEQADFVNGLLTASGKIFRYLARRSGRERLHG